MGIKRVILKKIISSNFHFTFKMHIQNAHVFTVFSASVVWVIHKVSSIINFDYSEWWTVQKWQKRFTYIALLSAILINGIVSCEHQSSTNENFPAEKLNHANLITNEKGSLIKSETAICLTRARLFVLIVMSQKRKVWRWGRHILGKSLRSYSAKRVVLLVTVFFAFIFLGGYCLEEGNKGNLPFGRKRWC